MSEEKLTLGEYFKREREIKGIDLKEIEERTKISAQTLIFLEEDQLDMLPPRTFLRGFLRVISKEFHFDEEELLAHLEETLASHEQKNKQAKVVVLSQQTGNAPDADHYCSHPDRHCHLRRLVKEVRTGASGRPEDQ